MTYQHNFLGQQVTNLLNWKEGLTIAKEQMMDIKKAQIKPRRGVTTLLRSTRALMLSQNMQGKEFAEQSGVSMPVAHRLKAGTLTNCAVKTEVRLRKWLADNTSPTPTDPESGQVWYDVPDPDKPTMAVDGMSVEEVMEKCIIDNLEAEVLAKDGMLFMLREVTVEQQKTIKKLKRQRDKLISLL